MNSEPNWAEVDGEAEMDYSHRPTLLPNLGPKIGSSLPETPEIDDPDIDTSDPAVRTFLNSLPNNGPYRIMITNLPQNITKESLESTLTTEYRITARITYKPGVPYCFLNFDNRNHCLESTSLFGARIHGAAVKLKVNPSDQQAEIRRANTATRNSGGSSRMTLSGSTGGRFKNLARDSSGTSLRTTKHRHPVGGSIRKKRSNARNNQSSSQSKQPTNPWNNSESRNQPKSDYKILARRKQPAQPSSNRRFDRATSSGASSAPSRQRDDMRAPRRQDNFRDRRERGGRDDRRENRDNRDNRDDAFSFRNRRDQRREDDISRQRDPRREDDGPRRRKLREDDGRADGALNWRSNTNNTPTRPRVDRRDPGREVSTESNFSRRAVNSTPRRTPAQKEKEKDAQASKNRFANKFDLLAEDED